MRKIKGLIKQIDTMNKTNYEVKLTVHLERQNKLLE